MLSGALFVESTFQKIHLENNLFRFFAGKSGVRQRYGLLEAEMLFGCMIQFYSPENFSILLYNF